MSYKYGSNHLLQTKDTYQRLQNGVRKPLPKDGEVLAETLIHFSGGIDSTYVLWKWLKDNPNKYAIVHHINLKSYENRNEKELEAVDKILRWFDTQGLKNYFYIESGFDYGTIPGTNADVEVCGYFAGTILKTNRFYNVTKNHLPIYKRDSDREERRRFITNFVSRKEIEFIYPLYGKEKWQVISEIPEELFNLTWYCRTPLEGEKCQRCFTCQDVEKSFNRIEEEKLKNFLQGF